MEKNSQTDIERTKKDNFSLKSSFKKVEGQKISGCLFLFSTAFKKAANWFPSILDHVAKEKSYSFFAEESNYFVRVICKINKDLNTFYFIQYLKPFTKLTILRAVRSLVASAFILSFRKKARIAWYRQQYSCNSRRICLGYSEQYRPRLPPPPNATGSKSHGIYLWIVKFCKVRVRKILTEKKLKITYLKTSKLRKIQLLSVKRLPFLAR